MKYPQIFGLILLALLAAACLNSIELIPSMIPVENRPEGDMAAIFTYKETAGGAAITGIKTDPGREPDAFRRDAALQALGALLDSRGILKMEETIDGLSIKEIDHSAFARFPPGQSSNSLSRGTGLLPPEIKGIRFPASLETIGADAFAGNRDLEFIGFPVNSRLREIGRGGFYGAGLTSVELPASLRSLGRAAFYLNEKLVTVDLSKTKLDKIDDLMFFQCRELASVSLPSTVGVLGKMAFANCGNLISFEAPRALRRVEDMAFKSCFSLIRADFSTLAAKQLKTGQDSFRETGFRDGYARPDVWVKIPEGAAIDPRGGSAGFFTGVYGDNWDTGWNSITGTGPATWVKVFAGGVQVWPIQL